ncbi:MAG: type 4a pilus biogenesis protein PilO [Patescibacteria group bacterium]|nr:type 4a pilus biogenesis protein PilO [Patescibacteria group bacterium]
MIRLLLPLIMIGLAGLIFFQFSDPLLAEIDELKVEKATLNEGLDNAKELRLVLDQLLETYNNFNPNDVDRLDKFLPNNVDNVRLIIDINNIARPYNMNIRNLRIKADEERGEASVIEGGSTLNKGAVVLGFSVSGSYSNFQAFLDDLARSLRLVDSVSVSFSSNERNFYNYNVEIQTYWLR